MYHSSSSQTPEQLSSSDGTSHDGNEQLHTSFPFEIHLFQMRKDSRECDRAACIGQGMSPAF